MSDLVLRGGGQRRLSAAQMRELKRQMKLAQRKLDTMKDTIEITELNEDIAVEQLLEKLTTTNEV